VATSSYKYGNFTGNSSYLTMQSYLYYKVRPPCWAVPALLPRLAADSCSQPAAARLDCCLACASRSPPPQTSTAGRATLRQRSLRTSARCAARRRGALGLPDVEALQAAVTASGEAPLCGTKPLWHRSAPRPQKPLVMYDCELVNVPPKMPASPCEQSHGRGCAMGSCQHVRSPSLTCPAS
jgi:hypothetical protein